MKTYPPAVFAKRYKKAFDYANPYESVAYSLDPHGHGWDRLAALAGEYARGENTWAHTKRMLDDNLADLTRLLDAEITNDPTALAQRLTDILTTASAAADGQPLPDPRV